MLILARSHQVPRRPEGSTIKVRKPAFSAAKPNFYSSPHSAFRISHYLLIAQGSTDQ